MSSTKDAVATMGMLLPDDVGGRDAVHVAVISATAATKLAPGQDVGFIEREKAGVVSHPLGIVDPFLKTMVQPDQRFWLYLYPRTITGLSHKWSHPAFPDDDAGGNVYSPPSQKMASEKWLRDFCASADCPGYEQVIAAAERESDSKYLHFNGMDAHGEIPAEFWDHVEIVLGRKIAVRPDYFSCAC